MAALMTCARDDLTKRSKVYSRMYKYGDFDVFTRDINEAGDACQSTKQGIRFAMTGIKGVGAGVVETIYSRDDNVEVTVKDFMNLSSV